MNNENINWYSAPFVERLTHDLVKLCTEKGFLDGQIYQIEELNKIWHDSAPEYMTNAVPEIPHYPTVAIAWAAFFGMGVASLWDSDWESAKDEDLYKLIRDARGFDCMDDHVIEDILKLLPQNPTRADSLTKLLQDCSDIAISLIRKENIEPQSVAAFHMFAKTTEVMFQLGVTIELYALGYKYHKVDMNLN